MPFSQHLVTCELRRHTTGGAAGKACEIIRDLSHSVNCIVRLRCHENCYWISSESIFTCETRCEIGHDTEHFDVAGCVSLYERVSISQYGFERYEN